MDQEDAPAGHGGPPGRAGMNGIRPTPLRLVWHEAEGSLVAHFEPTGAEGRGATRLDVAALREAIAAGGWSALYCDDATLDAFVRQAAAGEPFSARIAERRDGCFRIEVAADAMTAWLWLDPPFGGAPVGRESIDSALAAQGVVGGILDGEIGRALAAGIVERHPIARGRPAEPGTPASFRSLIPDIRARGPRVDEWSVVDYRAMSQLVVVKAGDPLMRRTPATPGRAGEDVKGMVIPADGVADTPFAAGLRGASPAPDDPDLLVADITGQPVPRPDGVDVEPTITLPAVDLASGHVEFDGTVNVSGDVAAGMRIHASGDVFVGGTVEAARIEAGGSITVKAGAIGCMDPRGVLQPARLMAKGTISLQFCENAVIESGDDIRVGEFVVHSELTAPNCIVIGRPGARRSQLIGGVARAGAALSVGKLGSQAGVRTQVLVGYQPNVWSELTSVLEALRANESQQDDLRKVLALTADTTRADRRATRDKAERTLAAILQADELLQARHAELQAMLRLAENAHVAVGEGVYPKVEVQLGSLLWKSVEPLPAGTLQVDGEAVLFIAGGGRSAAPG